MARRVRVTFEAENISAVGYKTYALVEGDAEKVTIHLSAVKIVWKTMQFV